MPIKKSAQKALKQSEKRQKLNSLYKQKIKKAWKSKNIKEIYKILDKAAKKGIISKNKAARKKSQAVRICSSSTKGQTLKDQKK